MNIEALIPMLIFYGAYIVKGVLLRRKGIEVNRLAKGSKPSHTRRVEMLLLPLTYGIALLQFAGVFGLLPLPETEPYLSIAGTVVALTGCVFFICALVALKNSWRAGIDNSQKTELRTGGILRLSRNPAFLGFDLFYIGTAAVMPNLFLIVLTAAALVVFHLQIAEEEKFLSAAFGAAYADYKKKVRRYI